MQESPPILENVNTVGLHARNIWLRKSQCLWEAGTVPHWGRYSVEIRPECEGLAH